MAAEKVEIKRYRRLQEWDYSKGASLFITIAIDRSNAVRPSSLASRTQSSSHALHSRPSPLPPPSPQAWLLSPFGKVEHGRMVLSELGQVVNESLEAIPRLNPGISLFGHVVMPDHVHFNCHLAAGLDEPLKVLGNAIRRFKNYTTKMAKRLVEHSSTITTGSTISTSSTITTGLAISSSSAITTDPTITTAVDKVGCGLSVGKVGCGREASEDGRGSEDGRIAFGQFWQQGYHDHLCLSRSFIDSTERYIAYNPMKWELMHGTSDSLRIVEPLISPRLDPADWWKGVGNIGLLGSGEKIVALRVSRKVNTPNGIANVIAKMERAVAKGYVILSGFISPGEKAVRDMLCRNSNAKFIRILPSCIPNLCFRPESQYIEPFAQGRYLEIAKGNDEVEFGRSACLDLNDEIVKIAKSGEGVAVYYRSNTVRPSSLASRSQPSSLALS